MSGRQQRQETSQPSRRRRRSSSDGTDRRSKKCPRGRSPSPGLLLAIGRGPIGPILSLQKMSEPRLLLPELDVRLELLLAIFAPLRWVTAHRVLALRVGRCGHPRERSIIAQVLVVDPTRLRVDDNQSSAVDTVDFDRDDSFRSVLGLIRNFHTMEEPAGIPSARCKTSLASIYGLMSETSPAFHLPVSPLVRSLLDDTSLALSKFLEDETVHGFLPMPGRRHRRYCRTSSSFPGPYSVPPGVTSITLEKAFRFLVRLTGLLDGDHAFRGLRGLVVPGLVAVNVRGFPGASVG